MTFFFGAPAACPITSSNGILTSTNLPHTCATSDTLNTLYNIAFITIGALSLMVLVIAGTRYALSKGEPDNIQKAKNEIKYAIIGLVIAAFGAALVNHVLTDIL